jgi:isopenicillin N synthase-like dioxygenase
VAIDTNRENNRGNNFNRAEIKVESPIQTLKSPLNVAATAAPLIRRVPELSLTNYINGTRDEKALFIEQLFLGLKDYGFIILKDHGIPARLIEQAYSLLEKVFALPLDAKNRYALQENGFQRGYTPFGTEHAKNTSIKDLKEFWHVGRELPEGHRYGDIYPKNVWPEELEDFKPTMAKIHRSLDEVAKVLLEALTYPLRLKGDYFSKMMSEGNSILRLLHYPPIPEGTDPRCVRAAAHEDINLITLLVSATTSGLQLKDRDGSWLPVDCEPNCLIVDSGDMLSRMTNDILPSTTHRVVNPDDGKNLSRYSMPFFVHPNPDALLNCIPSCAGSGEKYQPITSQDFLMQRLREIGLLKS